MTMKIHVERETAYIIVHAQYCVLTYTKYTCGAGARLMAFSCFVKANVILVLYFCILTDLNKFLV